MQSISEWLQSLGLDQYAQVFTDNDIDLELIPSLSDQDLKELGVSSMGHRKKLLKAIAVFDNATAPSPTASASPAPADTGERRQLTVMFCDMVGFTELASRVDPEVLQKIIRAYEDTCAAAITRYEGYVFQRLGDGIVAFFGYPLAHEGEAERAIRAGLDIIEALSTLEVAEVGHLSVRIGIATGLLVVASAEKGAVGETMNLAARLQSIAQVNTIVVSERVRRLAGGAVEYEDLGEQTLKGISRPTHVYRIESVSEAASRFEAAHAEQITPLVGRDQEIALLLDRWRQAQDGEGQVVLLSGEPGIGKSRILSALGEHLADESFSLLSSQCSPFYANTAFYPIADQMAREAGFERHDDADAKLDKLEALFARLGLNLLEVMPLFASALSIPSGERYPPLDMSPQKQKDRTIAALAQQVVVTSHEQSVLFVVEDLHWSDPTSIEVLGAVIDAVRDARVLVVCTFRPEFDPPWSAHGHVIGLNLSKLTRAQSSAMVSKLAAGKALPEELVEQILVKTDGVPLFVEELTKSILESGELTDSGDRYEYAGGAHGVTIPATLRDSLMARLDRYKPVKQIAQIGAAIGREFSYELISAVAPLPTTQLDGALSQLTDSGLAFRSGTPPEATYTFKHALVQDAAYDSLLKSRRQELHGKIAWEIEARFPSIKDTEPELLAHHLTTAGETETAIPLWQKAGELALKRMALTEAISHLDHGLELVAILPHSHERDASELALRVPLGTAWMALKGWPAPEAWSSLHPALALAKSLERNDALVHILWGLTQNFLAQGRAGETLQWAEEMLDLAESTADHDLLIMGHTLGCTYYFWKGDLIEALEHGNKVLALYGEEKHRYLVDLLNLDPKTAVGVYNTISTWMLGYPDRAVRISDETVVHARRLGRPFDLGWALSFGADVFGFRGEPEDLRKRAEECERVGQENSMPFLFAFLAASRLGVATIEEGRFAEGISLMKAAGAAWRASGGKSNVYTKPSLVEAMASAGDLVGALQQIEKCLEQVKRPGWQERLSYAEILRLKGWILTLKDDLEDAEKYYLASLDWAREQQAKSWELRTSTSLARLWRGQGKRKEARELLAPIYNWFTEGFDTKDLREAKALLDDLES